MVLCESRLKSIARVTGFFVRFGFGVAAVLLAACSGNALPPDAFVAVPSADAPADGRNACPDLRGTFDIRGAPLTDAIAGRPPPDTHGLPVVMTFKPGPTSIEGWWVVPRKRLAAFATTMSEDSPKRYSRWRRLMLYQQLPETQKQNFEGYLKDVAELGPASPIFALVVGRSCADHWMLVDVTRRQTAGKNGNPRSEEVETWLARDAAGALLVKRVTYTLKHYSIWAPAVQSIRTSSSTQYARVPQVDPESAEPLVDADLPSDPLTRPRTLMSCAEVPQHVEQFSQRLKALLPPKAVVLQFALKPVRQRDADGNCPFAVVDVEIEGPDAYAVSRTTYWVRREPNVDSVEDLPSPDGRRRETRQRFRVVLR